MTVRIRIPSSDDHEPFPADPPRPSPRPPALLIAALLALSVVVALVVSLVSGADMSTSAVPAPFETTAEERRNPVPASAEEWSERTLPGEGEILAMGMIGDAPVAVVTDWSEAHIWRLTDDAWQLDGRTDLGVESAVVMDNRILLLADQGSRPTVWEWVDGSPRYIFQPTSGSIVGMWSVSGRLIASVAPSASGLEQTIRSGRSDVLWMESRERDFHKLTLVNIESVLAVAGDSGLITVGGRDADGQAAVGFVHDDRVLANPVPGAPLLSAVTDLAGDPASPVALVSVANRRRGTHDEIRSAGRDWALVTRGVDLVGIAVIDDVVVGVTQDGSVVRHWLDGEDLPVPPSPPWSYGFVRGLAVLDDEPVAFGSSENRTPMFMGPSAGFADVMLPLGSWERYHSEESDGFGLVHIGSREYAIHDGKLFSRAWNADRWHPAGPDELRVFGTPTIVELEWGLVLVPSAGPGLWTSAHGGRWTRVEGSDTARIKEVATDGTVLVGITHLGAVGGPMSDVTVLDRNREVTRLTLPFHVIGPHWVEGVGFVGTVAPPESGYVTSQDGIEWEQHGGTGLFNTVVGFQGSLYLSTGVAVVSDDPPAEVPSGDGWLLHYQGGVPMWVDVSGSTWIHTGQEWIDVGFGVLDGLPGRPHSLALRGSSLFALTRGLDGLAETYVLELD
jgi:hypothetical protein